MTVVFFATAEKSSVVAFSYHRPSKQATISILEIVPHANPLSIPQHFLCRSKQRLTRRIAAKHPQVLTF